VKPVKFSHYIEYAGLRLVSETIGRLPLDAGPSICAGVARFAGRYIKGLRTRALRNLGHAMPEMSEARRSEVLIEMLDSLTRTLTEYRYLQKLTDDKDRIEVVGLEHLHAAKGAGNGAVLVTGHFGNWEAVRIAFAQNGWPPAIIYREFNNPLFDRFGQKLMSVTDAPIFHKGRRGSLGMLRHVRGGGATLILTDQRFSRAPEIPFFGQPARTSMGSAEIALNYGAALLPVRGERIGRTSRFRVVIEPPLETVERSAEEVTAEINNRLETWVRDRPEQYFWMHNRWGKISSGKRPQP